MTPVLRTIHGSHLYGLAHAGSDVDVYEVVLDGRGEHAIEGIAGGKHDSTRVGFQAFQRHLDMGVPQALEALWSPVAEVHPVWRPFLASYQPGYGAVITRHIRTLRHFGDYHLRNKQPTYDELPVKTRKHALRLSRNLRLFMERGRFNPRLDASEVAWLLDVVASDQHTFVKELRAMCPLELPDSMFRHWRADGDRSSI